MENTAIADNFDLLAKLMDIHGENSFKTKTYAIAAFNIEKLPMQLKDTPREKIFTIKGIGDSVGKKVIEMVDSGKLEILSEYISKTPPGVIEMLNIKGIGPKKINTIWKQMEIESLGELLYACNENRLTLFKGFGEKTQKNVQDAINFYFFAYSISPFRLPGAYFLRRCWCSIVRFFGVKYSTPTTLIQRNILRKGCWCEILYLKLLIIYSRP